jgi:hypothetical protein
MDSKMGLEADTILVVSVIIGRTQSMIASKTAGTFIDQGLPGGCGTIAVITVEVGAINVVAGYIKKTSFASV